ncbi:MAG: class I SAM-dependent methyltransferase [Planctomycetota bacterium]
MAAHVCPWWGGYFIDNPVRRWIHPPDAIVAPHVRPGMRVLDFGCGMGIFTLALARGVGAEGVVIAADLQPQMLRAVERRARKAGLAERIRPHECRPDSLALHETVDFALAFYSAHETPDPPRLLAEILGCLRPGGRLLLVEPAGHVTRAAFEAMVGNAECMGARVCDRPRIRFSHTALLEVDGAAA